MGLCVSTSDQDQNLQSEEDGKKLKQEYKVLLLGSGESGKSTIVKQMKIIYPSTSFSQAELEAYRPVVYKNVLDSAHSVLVHMRKRLRMDCEDLRNSLLADKILEYQIPSIKITSTSHLPSTLATASRMGSGKAPGKLSKTDTDEVMEGEAEDKREGDNDDEDDTDANRTVGPQKDDSDLDEVWFSPEIAQAIDRVWRDPHFRKVMDEHSSDFYLMDNARYFFTEMLRIGEAGYVPNESDVLHARQKSFGVTEERFAMDDLRIHMFDVGGQRSERRKWIYCFPSVTTVIFCAALSEYDQVLLEQKNQNRMHDSIKLFDAVINSPWFLRTSFILFLNKTDVFKWKIPKIPLQKYFPEFTGGKDINKAAKYILWRFMDVNRAKLEVYPHLTQATDTHNVRLVFESVKQTILQNALKGSGML